MRSRWLVYAVVYIFYLTTFGYAEVRLVVDTDIQWTSTTYPSVDCTVTSGGGHTGSPLDNAYRESAPYIDVRTKGILPANSAAVNTPLIQALFDAITSGTVIYFPAGTYLVNAGLTITSKSNYRIIGAGDGTGAAAVSIRWDGNGDNTATLLEISGGGWAEWSNIQFMGNNVATTPAYDRPKTNIGTYVHGGNRHMKWRNCSWYQFNYGFYQGHLTVAEGGNDASQWFSPEFGYNIVGWVNDGVNSIGNNQYDPWFEYNGTAIQIGSADHISSGPTSTTIYNPDFSHDNTDIIGRGAFYNLTIITPRSEAAVKFMDMPGANASLSRIVMVNPEINFNTSATGGTGDDSASTNPYLDTDLATLHVIGGTFGVLGDIMQFRLNGQAASFIGSDFSYPEIFTPSDNAFTTGVKVTLSGTRAWNGTDAYVALSDGDRYSQNGSSLYTFVANDNTPSVKTSNWWKTAAGQAQDITIFDDAYLGQKITIVCSDNLTTFVNSGGATGLFLHGSADWTCPSIWSNISFVREENDVWVQAGPPMVR